MRWLVTLVALVSVCAGCDAPATPAPADPAPRPEAAPARELVDMPVSWPAHAELDATALARLSPAAAAAVAQSPLPALVPEQPELLGAATVMTKPKWYAVSSRHDGLTVSLHASRAAHRYAHIPPTKGNRAVRGGHGFVERNSGIWSVSWIEHGAAYALDLECAQLADARCQDDALLMQLAERLVYVGGLGAEETP